MNLKKTLSFILLSSLLLQQTYTSNKIEKKQITQKETPIKKLEKQLKLIQYIYATINLPISGFVSYNTYKFLGKYLWYFNHLPDPSITTAPIMFGIFTGTIASFIATNYFLCYLSTRFQQKALTKFQNSLIDKDKKSLS